MYIGPLLLGIIIGIGTASGYFLSLPVASKNPHKYGAPVTVLVAQPTPALPSEIKTSARPPERSKPTVSDAPFAKPAVEPGQQTAALTPQPKPAQASVEEASPDSQSKTAQPVEDIPTDKVKVASKPEREDASTDDNLDSGRAYFPGLSIGGAPPGQTAPKAPEAKIVPPKPEPAARDQVNAETTTQSETSVASAATPQDPAVDASPPVIKQADLVLPRRNPRLQKRRR